MILPAGGATYLQEIGRHSLLKLNVTTYRHFSRTSKIKKGQKCEILCLSTRPLKIFSSKTAQQNSKIFHTKSP